MNEEERLLQDLAEALAEIHERENRHYAENSRIIYRNNRPIRADVLNRQRNQRKIDQLRARVIMIDNRLTNLRGNNG